MQSEHEVPGLAPSYQFVILILVVRKGSIGRATENRDSTSGRGFAGAGLWEGYIHIPGASEHQGFEGRFEVQPTSHFSIQID